MTNSLFTHYPIFAVVAWAMIDRLDLLTSAKFNPQLATRDF